MLRVLWNGNGVEVNNAVDSVVGFLHLYPLHERAGVITEVERVG
jgi:hypothetical protein